MKLLFLTTVLLICTLTLCAQCDQCKTKLSFGTPRNYELTSTSDESGNRVFSKEERYSNLDGGHSLPDTSAKFKELSSKIIASLAKKYSSRFVDSCKITRIQMNDSELENSSEFSFRATILLTITKSVHYKFGLDFSKECELLKPNFPNIPDSKLFNQGITCCKAVLISKSDKINPIKAIGQIDIIHTPYSHEVISDKSATLIWIVRSTETKPDKAGFVRIYDKYVDFYTGKILKRVTTKYNPNPVIIEDSPVIIQ
jgi:hypothetical protein